MSTLLLWTLVGIAALALTCFVHGEIETDMSRSKFIFLTLTGMGSVPFGYAASWLLVDQSPNFDITPHLAFGVTMWVTAIIYSITFILSRRDVALSY